MSKLLFLFLAGLIHLAAPAAGSSLNGTFLYLGTPKAEKLPTDSLNSYFHELQELGMDTLVIEASRHQVGDCRNPSFAWVQRFPHKLRAILDVARKNKLKVYVGLVSSMNACPEFYLPTNFSKTLIDTEKTLKELNSVIQTHEAFGGWYLPDEPGHLEPYYFEYYKKLTNIIRKDSQAGVLVSPYLKGSYGVISPKELALRAEAFHKETGINIQAWQDSVGADGVLDKKLFYTHLAKALGSGIWANVELFNWGKELFQGGGYTATSLTRLNQQLQQTNSPLIGKRISWLGQIHLTPRLKSSLRGKLLTPVSYQYFRPVSREYPDRGSKLTNQMTASAVDFKHPEWVGVLGDVKVIFDFGKPQKFNWIAVHLLHSKSEGISFPKEMEIFCEDEGSVKVSNEKISIEMSDSEYVFSQEKPLDFKCRKVLLVLKNHSWTFLSEVEFSGL